MKDSAEKSSLKIKNDKINHKSKLSKRQVILTYFNGKCDGRDLECKKQRDFQGVLIGHRFNGFRRIKKSKKEPSF